MSKYPHQSQWSLQRRYNFPRFDRGTELARHRRKCLAVAIAATVAVGLFYEFSPFTRPTKEFALRNFHQGHELEDEKSSVMAIFTLRRPENLRRQIEEEHDIVQAHK